MAGTRTGARTFLNIVQVACRMSHIAGFRAGLRQILGTDAGDELFGFWDPFCQYVESLIALDNYFNKRDAGLPDIAPGDEDGPFG